MPEVCSSIKTIHPSMADVKFRKTPLSSRLGFAWANVIRGYQ